MVAARDRLDAAGMHQERKRIVGNNPDIASSSTALNAIRARLAHQTDAHRSLSGTPLSRYDEDADNSEVRTSGPDATVPKPKRDPPSTMLLAALEDESIESISEYYARGQNTGDSAVAGGYNNNRSQTSSSPGNNTNEVTSSMYNTVSVGDVIYARHTMDTGGSYLKGEVKAVIHKGFRSARYDVDVGGGRIITVPWTDVKYADAKGRDICEDSGDERDWSSDRRNASRDDANADAEVDCFGRSTTLKARKLETLTEQSAKLDTLAGSVPLESSTRIQGTASDTASIASPPTVSSSAGLVVSDAVLSMAKGGWRKKTSALS
jgi:hypothetical protein